MATALHLELADAHLADDLAQTFDAYGFKVTTTSPLVGDAEVTITKPRLRGRARFTVSVLETLRQWMTTRQPSCPVVMRSGDGTHRFESAREIESALIGGATRSSAPAGGSS